MLYNASITEYLPVSGSANDGSLVRGASVLPAGVAISCHAAERSLTSQTLLATRGVSSDTKVNVPCGRLERLLAREPIDGDTLRLREPYVTGTRTKQYVVVACTRRGAGMGGATNTYELSLREVQGG